MRKFLGTLLGLAIVIGAVGFFRNWYSVSKTDEGTETNVNVRINKERIKEDVDLAREKASALGDRISGESSGEKEEEDPFAVPPTEIEP